MTKSKVKAINSRRYFITANSIVEINAACLAKAYRCRSALSQKRGAYSVLRTIQCLRGKVATKFNPRINTMNVITFDTHEFFNELRSSGFSEQQAETITRLQKAAIASTLEQAKHEYDLDNISTKRDLNELELRLTIKMGTMLSVAVGGRLHQYHPRQNLFHAVLLVQPLIFLYGSYHWFSSHSLWVSRFCYWLGVGLWILISFLPETPRLFWPID